MDLRQLKYFVGVVEAGSFTKAAAQLNVAQSALSLHVRQLEEGFRTQLVVRDRTGVKPTSSGMRLVEHARTILAQVSLAEVELTSRVRQPCGEVTIGIPSGAARVIVAELLVAAKERLPNVSLQIVEGMSGLIDEWLAAGRLNLAVVYKNGASSSGCTLLTREELYLVAPPTKPPFEDTVRLVDLHRYPLVVPMRVNNLRRSVADVVLQKGCTLNVHFEVDSLSTIINIVMDGKAYSILTPSAVQREAALRQVRMVRIVEPSIVRPVALVTNPRDEASAAVAAVRALVLELVHRLTDEGKWPTMIRANEAAPVR
ncbi:LysR family transcriptional regulator [Bradyrhizobium sp. USDA 4486]